MKYRRCYFLLIMSCATTTAFAVEIPPAHHAWGRFKPNSWRRVRITTETFGSENSKSVDIKSVTTRLIKVEKEGYVVAQEEKIGDQITKRSQIQHAWDDSIPNATTKEKYGLGEVQLEGKTFTCQTHTLTTASDKTRTSTKSWYSPDHEPYFLKQLTRVTGNRRQTTVTTVMRRAVTKEAVNRKLSCWESETKDSTPSSTATTTTFSSKEVPGGLVLSESEVNDKQQGQLRKIRVELIGFEAAP